MIEWWHQTTSLFHGPGSRAATSNPTTKWALLKVACFRCQALEHPRELPRRDQAVWLWCERPAHRLHGQLLCGHSLLYVCEFPLLFTLEIHISMYSRKAFQHMTSHHKLAPQRVFAMWVLIIEHICGTSLSPVFCSQSVCRAPTTRFSQTSGAWACHWWRWPSAASPSLPLMPGSSSWSSASPSRGTRPQQRPPHSPGPQEDQAAVSDWVPRIHGSHRNSFINPFGLFEYLLVVLLLTNVKCWGPPLSNITSESAFSDFPIIPIICVPQHTDPTADLPWLFLSCWITLSMRCVDYHVILFV